MTSLYALGGEGDRLSLAAITRIAKTPTVDHIAQFDLAVQAKAASPNRERWRPATTEVASFEVRVAAYFNPEVFVQTRINAFEKETELQAFVAQLNEDSANPKSRRTAASLATAVAAKLKMLGWTDAWTVRTETAQSEQASHTQMSIQRNDIAWNRRRRYDGFSVLAAHPQIQLSAHEMCKTYRDKDVVEKDFRVIKGTVALKPFYHRIDNEVRAHVTVCILAMLLERTLHHRLAASKSHHSASTALDRLATATLNLFRFGEKGPTLYRLNKLNYEQTTLLRALRMQELADEEVLRTRIHPR